MIRTLLVFRHAKSPPAEPGQTDFARPLAARGRKDANRMGRAIRELGLVPDLVLVSSARRTLETWERASAELGGPVPARALKSLYDAGPQRLLGVLQRVGPDERRVMLIGHNPGLHNLAVQLAAGGDQDLRDRLGEKLPTAALVAIDFAIDSWRDLGMGGGTLVRFIAPQSLED